MKGYYRKPLDVEKWGNVGLWEGIDAAYIVSGTEPERGPDAYLTNDADAVHQAMLAAVGTGTLTPLRVTESGPTYFLAAETVKWAKEKGFPVPEGLDAAVQATVRAHLTRHKAEKAAQTGDSAFSEDLLDLWRTKDLWSEDEFVALLCGVKPEAFTGSARTANRATEQAARSAIERAIFVEVLPSIWQQEPAKWEGRFVPPRDIQYFTPANAIRWAETKRKEFPKFPKFAGVAEAQTGQTNESVKTGGASDGPDVVVPSAHLALLPDHLSPPVISSLIVAADSNDRPVLLVTPEELIEAFGKDDEELASDLKRLFETYHKVPWANAARRVKGTRGRQNQPPKFDLWELLATLPGTAYAPRLSRKQAWAKFKKHFPGYYAAMEHLEDIYTST